MGLTYESVSSGWTCAVTAVEFACTSSVNLAPGGNTPFTAKFLVSAKGGQTVGLSVVARSANDGVGITGNSYQYVGVAFEVLAVTFTKLDTPSPSGVTTLVPVPVTTSAAVPSTATSGQAKTGTAKTGTAKTGTATGKSGSTKTTAASVLSATPAKGNGLAITGANAVRFGLVGLLLAALGGCLVTARRRAKA